VSRAFVKEDSSEPPLIVPRPPLPEGAANYVTQRGLALLHEERAQLEAARPDPDALDATRELAAYNARLSALLARIASAIVLDPARLPRDEARFSALITLRNDAGDERRYRIVGVDEADAHAGRIAFTAPLAIRDASRSRPRSPFVSAASASVTRWCCAGPTEKQSLRSSASTIRKKCRKRPRPLIW
jgi:transcription elongation factor GreB